MLTVLREAEGKFNLTYCFKSYKLSPKSVIGAGCFPFGSNKLVCFNECHVFAFHQIAKYDSTTSAYSHLAMNKNWCDIILQFWSNYWGRKKESKTLIRVIILRLCDRFRCKIIETKVISRT